MKIAITTQDGQVFQHFGKCPEFTVYTVENGNIKEKKILDAAGSGHSALAGFLQNEGVDTVICGGIGDGARKMLAAVGIQLVSCITGSIEEAAKAYLSGNLKDQGGSCAHKEHEHEGNHGCGHHCV